MSRPGVAVSNRSLSKAKQRASHAHLSQDVSGSPAPPPSSRPGRVDAIIVPASMPASFLQPAIDLAAYLGVFLVVLCSKQTRVGHVAKRVATTPGARSLIVPIPNGWKHPRFPTQTSAAEFQTANANRDSDLSAKRNVGLLLARLHGWNKIVFVDDDITHMDNIARLAGQLDRHQVAGMYVRQFPDNSVVCHARRLARMKQDIFVTGAVLGVHCNSLPLSFFPDIYNEDWFFFAKEAAAGKLPGVGNARQLRYDPFASPDRARREEFGDLLAEGLYAFIDEGDRSRPFDEQLRAAGQSYWSRFIDARCVVITEAKTTLHRLRDLGVSNGHLSSALNCVAAAESQLNTITPDLCVNFINAWRDDLDHWQRFSNAVNNVGSTREAMNFLELRRWTLAEFGAVVVDCETASGRLRVF
jgi:hypothetical protein